MKCPHQTAGERAAKQRNALRLEVLPSGDPRCLLERPAHWPESASSLRWIASGGSPTVFRKCRPGSRPECPGDSDGR